MKHRLILALTLCCCALAQGQQQFFLYLQTDNRQPFYVRLHDKLHSSAEDGYLILSGLSGDSSYTLTAGFPRNTFPEQVFTLNLRKRDEGFLLKNFGDKGWGLFNLQTMALIMSNEGRAEKKNPSSVTVRKSDPFSVLLSNAVNDSAVLITVVKPKASVVAAKEPAVSRTSAPAEAKPETGLAAREHQKQLPPDPATKVVAGSGTGTQPVAKETLSREKPATAAIQEKAAEPVTAPVAVSPVPLQPETPPHGGVSKAAELRTDTSWIAVFIDASAGNEDTVRVSVPFDHWVAIKQHQVKEGRSPVPVVKEIKPHQDSIITPQQPREVIAGNESKLPAANPAVPPNRQEPVARQQLPPPGSVAVTEKRGRQAGDSSSLVPRKETEPAAGQDMNNKNISAVNPLHKDSMALAAVKQKAEVKAPAAADSAASAFKASVKASIPNSNCKDSAWDSDVDKLRIKMLAAKTDEEKMALGAKLYKVKCLTVKQVRALSEMFPSDEGKYKWFDSTYSYVTDSGDFPLLGDLLTDKYYQNRFKAMLR